MRNLEYKLKDRKIDFTKLEKYGFEKKYESYVYREKILDNQFEVIISFSENKSVSRVVELFDGEEYALVDVEESVGPFVGIVREAYEKVIDKIVEKCTIQNVYKSLQANHVIEYIRNKYGDMLEFLWDDANAIWRNKTNAKWYGALLQVSKEKLGIKSEDVVEIIDLKYQKGETEQIVDNKLVYPGYHMNKNSWITVILDNSMENNELEKLIDNSYELSLKAK